MMHPLWNLFRIFFKIGAFTFGGGYVMIPIIQEEIVSRHKLLPAEEVSELLVLAQSLPGMMAVNSATAVGYRLYGKKGAVVGALGMALPSFLMIVLLASVILQLQDNARLQGAFLWIRAVVVGMIFAAAIQMAKPCKGKPVLIAVAVAALVLVLAGVHPFALILGGAVLGLVLTAKGASDAAGGGAGK